VSSELLIVDRCCWRSLLFEDGSMTRAYFFTREKIPREDVRKMDRIICSLQDKVQQRARELLKDLPGIAKEDLKQ